MAYPPAGNMMKIMLSSSDEDMLAKTAGILKVYIDTQCIRPGLMCIGPADAPVYKIKDIYSKIIYAKPSERDELADLYEKLDSYVIGNPDFRNVIVQYDING